MTKYVYKDHDGKFVFNLGVHKTHTFINVRFQFIHVWSPN